MTRIVIASGKGGTGKTLVATNIAAILARAGQQVTYLDCDVEAPNGHLFLKPDLAPAEVITIVAPTGVDPHRCILCGKCAEVCQYNAIARAGEQMLFFPELCHACGACVLVCPSEAIIEEEKKIGDLRHGTCRIAYAPNNPIAFHDARAKTGEGGMTPRLIREVKKWGGNGITILDSPPGTACPTVESVKDANLTILVTDPTPFGLHDLKLAVLMTRQLGQEPVVLVNRADYLDDALRSYCREQELVIVGEIPDDRRIAEVYSAGDLVVEKLPHYRQLFEKLAEDILAQARSPRKIGPLPPPLEEGEAELEKSQPPIGDGPRPREVVVISGKGGTGKTSLIASLIALAGPTTVVSDCDVDAADLHLLLKPEREESGLFSGSLAVEIIPDQCTACGACQRVCRFEAVIFTPPGPGEERGSYQIDPMACEGCGACLLVCPEDAISSRPAINGEWFVSRTRLGQIMTHARLGVAEENSGRLVALIREKAVDRALGEELSLVLIDGSPGIGCPVIASLTGAFFALAVAEPTVSGVHDLERILDLARHFSVPAGVVINKADLNLEMSERIRKLAKSFGAEVLGEIPYDTSFTRAQMAGLSITEFAEGPAAQAVRELWAAVRQRLEA